jgi:membrane protein
MTYLKQAFELLQETAQAYGRDKGPLLAAGLSYYAIFSLAPLLVIAVAVAGFVFGETAVEEELAAQIAGIVGTEAAIIIQDLIGALSQSPESLTAAILSTGLMFFGASGVFNQLKHGLNLVWGIEPDPDEGILWIIRTRLLAVVMVIGMGFLLLLSLAVSTMVTALNEVLSILLPVVGGLLPLLDFLVMLAAITLLFAIIFKTLPDAELVWQDVWLGAGVTALLFVIGEFLLGLYLGAVSLASAYGALSSVIVLLFWVYISAQIFMFGAEFTQVYANKYGSQVLPADDALLILRRQQEEKPGSEILLSSQSEQAAAPLMRSSPQNGVAPPPPGLHLAVAMLALLIGFVVGLVAGFIGGWWKR